MWAQVPQPFEITVKGGGTDVAGVVLSVLPSLVAVLLVVMSNRSQRKRQRDDFKEQREQRAEDRKEEALQRERERAKIVQADRMASYAAMLAALDEMRDYGAAVATDPSPGSSAALPHYDRAQSTVVRECMRAALFAEREDLNRVLELAKMLDVIPHPVRDTTAWTTMRPPNPPRAAEGIAIATVAVHKRIRLELGLDEE